MPQNRIQSGTDQVVPDSNQSTIPLVPRPGAKFLQRDVQNIGSSSLNPCRCFLDSESCNHLPACRFEATTYHQLGLLYNTTCRFRFFLPVEHHSSERNIQPDVNENTLAKGTSLVMTDHIFWFSSVESFLIIGIWLTL